MADREGKKNGGHSAGGRERKADEQRHPEAVYAFWTADRLSIIR